MKKCMTESQFKKWMKGKKMVRVDGMAAGFERTPRSEWKDTASWTKGEEDATPYVLPGKFRHPTSSTGESYDYDRFYKACQSVQYAGGQYCVNVKKRRR